MACAACARRRELIMAKAAAIKAATLEHIRRMAREHKDKPHGRTIRTIQHAEVSRTCIDA